jgi:hypothetical protein
MKYSFFIVAAIILLITGSCKKDGAGSAETFSIATGSEVTFEPMTITYTVTQTGTSTLSEIVYGSENGSVTVSNPTFPWVVSFSASTDKNIWISASGSITNGSVDIKAEGDGATSHFEMENCYVHNH